MGKIHVAFFLEILFIYLNMLNIELWAQYHESNCESGELLHAYCKYSSVLKCEALACYNGQFNPAGLHTLHSLSLNWFTHSIHTSIGDINQ